MTEAAARNVSALLQQASRLVASHDETASGSPVMALARHIGRQMAAGTLPMDQVEEIVRLLRDRAFAGRAHHIATYLDGPDEQAVTARMHAVARRIVQPDPDDSPVPIARFRAAIERSRFAAVFTAHPTFALANPVYEALAELASTNPAAPPAHVPSFLTHRRVGPPTLDEEFTLATQAIMRGRTALDRLNAILLSEARTHWPQLWSTLVPRPIIMTSWVGYDTDGRTDIGWWDTLRLRLRMKQLQLGRMHDQIKDTPVANDLLTRVSAALDAVGAQITACPTGPEPEAISRFADVLINRSTEALTSSNDLAATFSEAIDAASPEDKMTLAVARAGFMAHGLSAAHTHTRLNATQLHNIARQRLGITDSPDIPAQRRALISRMNEALENVTPVEIDFGSLLMEQASAGRLMMTVRQILRHIDRTSPIRFLIAETETGYTLLTALWLARLYGVEEMIEISPLFETQEALENGEQIIEEALRSPHWRAYLQRTRKLSLQFGFSDSGRYVGQLAATYLIERLRIKVCDLLRKWDLAFVEVILFDTHGESIGRGAHPWRLADRFDYLSPPHARARYARAGIQMREETAFQGGDGYLLFGTQPLADATVSIIAEHAFAATPLDRDPVYDEPDFSADFFSTIANGMTGLVEDPGYAALLGAFGPSLIDKTGSRPSARQSDASSTVTRIKHPSQLRAIPNNAILQQLAWCANTLQGLGTAAARHPETFEKYLAESPRFRRAMDFAAHALAHSDHGVLRGVIRLLDPDLWLERATTQSDPARQEACLTLMHGLENLDFWASTQAMFRRIQSDHLALRRAWPDAPRMQSDELLLHAIRIALIEQIWLHSTKVPYFSPRHAFSRDVLTLKVLCLEVPGVLGELEQIFPYRADSGFDLDFHEPHGPRQEGTYRREYTEIFEPMQRLFQMVREISTGVMHHVGAFG
ncbi:putative phosphoenolpyruvate carboxylase [Gluconacetobacter sp. SXCC-1]|uniref:Phosphoenolpyruvate carboxylase n=1 Tax=Komagataeibacter rhaeticus TaxID=215221 RepID=A0A181CC55_9PROT|nr:phosphoenolpyruvate carboxylase [Komagataeibacter rhaeticus]ATU72060.1 phosphoenolpyruvate carboxylase [Komagataeibacter xylinus]EGG75491.1 putative phosphoenolpyruvate carboxylase [Gluconacetobacter sp. SXCC-1]QIP35815.1 phosphoenolpyruvate carboxylase [Komagataeibacter rhaeticus]QOC45574.1 phosphoenolpyruvate carboxylase [Komagataeibacter rhaeticus]WPP21762.1 phosphoenolpyruvate carboxylase [Komagataeibacter rhaeticus]